MWSITVLKTENENYPQAYNGHLENKTTIKSIVFGDIYPTEFMENNCYVWEGEITYDNHKTKHF